MKGLELSILIFFQSTINSLITNIQDKRFFSNRPILLERFMFSNLESNHKGMYLNLSLGDFPNHSDLLFNKPAEPLFYIFLFNSNKFPISDKSIYWKIQCNKTNNAIVSISNESYSQYTQHSWDFLLGRSRQKDPQDYIPLADQSDFTYISSIPTQLNLEYIPNDLNLNSTYYLTMLVCSDMNYGKILNVKSLNITFFNDKRKFLNRYDLDILDLEYKTFFLPFILSIVTVYTIFKYKTLIKPYHFIFFLISLCDIIEKSLFILITSRFNKHGHTNISFIISEIFTILKISLLFYVYHLTSRSYHLINIL